MPTFTLSVASSLKISSWDSKSLGSAGGEQASLVGGGKAFLLHYNSHNYLITNTLVCSAFMNWKLLLLL